ncbi:hypothetical protein BP6252_02614 [Coleophoma cylindrospora]|uniref:Zn(2)-C6 fungal-type domain-containing protein n=1 Tax=Coleophoma cylindrospora TaxID=1849047 RepID=A0A3D8SFV2_9HELO|nr:hypothetical protein BP6252_02614 [Coleophoma cylindrospora]
MDFSNPALHSDPTRGYVSALDGKAVTAPESSSSASHSSHLMPSNSAAAQQQAVPKIRRRNRMITSCLECRRRKLKCNKSHPCTNCVKFSRDCVFLAPALDQASQLKLTEIKEKVGSLERLLERDVAKSKTPAPALTQDRALPDDKEDDLPAAEDEKGLEPSPLAVVDAAYLDEGDGEQNDDMLDLGIQLGRMRMTERIGGFFRPKIANELEITLSQEPDSTGSPLEEFDPLPPAQDYLKPGPSYIAPASGFFFGQAGNQTTLVDFLPSRGAADRLIKQYFEAVHPIAHIVHKPTFEREYNSFWDEISLGIEPTNSVQTIVFAAMFSGVVSMDEANISSDFGVSKESLVDNFKLGAETALARANFLRTTRLETLQAFVMYLIPLCRAEVSRAHSVLVGAAIRMAMCMGIHRDGDNYGLSPLETHIRRLVWHQLLFLDIRTCEAQGPQPSIRKDDFDTKLPLNVNDSDFRATGRSPVGSDRWTDVTFTLLRFETNEMMRTVWVDRVRLERRKISLTAVLSKIESFRKNLAAKYDHMIDERIPLQRCAKYVMSLLHGRMLVMVLHPYHTSTKFPMPARLRQIMVASGIQMMEMAIAIETIPDLHIWAWYSGAWQQYHVAFLLLLEVYAHPHCQEVNRIWPCLDYVFETQASEPRQIKGRKIISELKRKTTVYQSMRGMRAPIAMQKHLGEQPARKSESQTSTSPEPVSNPYVGTSEKSAVGKAPIQPGVVFAGVSNGESLWALPDQESPEASSESGSGSQRPSLAPSAAGTDDLMAEIDWEAFDALFPPDQQTDGLIQPMFDFQNPANYY